MGHSVSHFVRTFVADYGYWAVALMLLCENAGLPVPGETTLLVASFLAYSEHKLHLGWIVVIATCAAALGDNLGFALGHFGGRPLLDRYRNFFRIHDDVLARGEKLFARYGAFTIFFARFVFGMRVIAGPLAGVLRMHWRKFAVYNFLGAVVWVSFIACSGYLFGQHWRPLVRALTRFNVVFVIAAIAVVLLVWWRERRGTNSAK
ncbi:MAG: DedA family protein [Terriglobales bacterium]|jgi:membrane-associated protein